MSDATDADPAADAEINRLLQAAGRGDARAADAVVALLYRELRVLARSRLRRSGEFTLLDTTALVHESYLRLQSAQAAGGEGAEAAPPVFSDRQHFFAYAARAMHSVVVDLVRARQAQRRGGDAEHLPLDTAVIEQAADPAHDAEILRVHEALQALAQADARLATVVEMRYFGGLSETEIAQALGVTERTVQRDWQKARLWLAMSLR
ncbi:MAG: sigma-70 family RNA polymerase sigma factor [Burkholderiaceae bacterium]|nr:sigma-70 family RNA polymerase sigma factor [Burkholderiaceae bacterium]